MKHLKKQYLLILMISMCNALLFAPEIPKPSIGNFAHKITPATTFGIGQNIFNKHDRVAYAEFDQFSYTNGSLLQFVPSFIYAFSNSLSLYTGLPLKYEKINGCTQRGIGNLFAELEYAFFNKITPEAQTLGTVIGNVTFPTTHLSHTCDHEITTTAYGTVFVGATASHTMPNWYGYISGGATFFQKKHDLRPGTSILYEGGIGRNLGNPWGITALGIIEANGILTKKDTYNGQSVANTESNLIFVGPSVCFSGNRWLISGGIQAAAYQHITGIQPKTRFRSTLIINIVF